MKMYRRNTGEKYTPFNHFEMQTQVIFNPDVGCKRANCTLTTLPKGSGSHDELHENSDQVFYIIQGAMKVYAQGKLLAEVREGDAIFVEAGDVHSMRNEEDVDTIFFAVTPHCRVSVGASAGVSSTANWSARSSRPPPGISSCVPPAWARTSRTSAGTTARSRAGQVVDQRSGADHFDEPTRGIDVGAKSEIWQLMRDLANRGKAIVMISSELPEIVGMSDRVYVMHRGAIVGELRGAEATEEQVMMLATYGKSDDR